MPSQIKMHSVLFWSRRRSFAQSFDSMSAPSINNATSEIPFETDIIGAWRICNISGIETEKKSEARERDSKGKRKMIE